MADKLVNCLKSVEQSNVIVDLDGTETIDSMGRLLHSAGQVEESVPWFVQAVRLDRLRIRSVPSDVRSRVRQLAAAPAGREDQP